MQSETLAAGCRSEIMKVFTPKPRASMGCWFSDRKKSRSPCTIKDTGSGTTTKKMFMQNQGLLDAGLLTEISVGLQTESETLEASYRTEK